MLASATSVVTRSMISKQVSSDELGQVFSVLASFESIVPLMATPMFNIIYESSIVQFPGSVYLVEGSTLFIIAMFFRLVALQYSAFIQDTIIIMIFVCYQQCDHVFQVQRPRLIRHVHVSRRDAEGS